MELLFAALETTRKEAEAQAQQHVGKDRTEDCGTNDGYVGAVVACLQQDHEQDKLDHGAEGGFQNDTEDLGEFTGELGTSEANHIGGRYHGNVVCDEYGQMPLRAGKMLRRSEDVRHWRKGDRLHTRAMATGTTGHSTFTHMEMTLLLRKQIFKNLSG